MSTTSTTLQMNESIVDLWHSLARLKRMLLLRITQELLISAATDARTTGISRFAVGPAIVDGSKAFFAQCVTTIDFLIA
jgi:hypothetical protein